MTFRRTVIALCLVMIIVLVVAAVSRPGRREGDGRAAATAASAAAAAGSPPAAALPSATEGAQRLDAVRTVKLFCDLVGSRRFWRAADLFATPGLWTRRQLRAVRRLDFRAARIGVAPQPHTLVVVARVLAAGGSGSPVHNGDTTLFFTLGRVGSTAGGWLIIAVTTSP